uniref:VWA-Hint protein Vwaint domain-containing protein n=1 Tax=Ananas comosus var. bracteatus TaxID=296719 RepID=A0A6V7P1H8_ANACO|nr:unnamed protein product [Ananas comosus var. bracteatus]
MDSEQLREYAHKMVDFIADYYKMIESFPVLSQVEPGYLKDLLPDLAPSKPENLEDVFVDKNCNIVNACFRWLSERLRYSGKQWLGIWVIQGTASEAVLVVLLAARDKILSKAGRKSLEKLVVYCSDQTHSAMLSACQVSTTSSAAVDSLLKLAKISKDQSALIQSLSANPDEELQQLQERMVDHQRYRTTGRAYMLSGLSSHSMQRATALGNSIESANLVGAYQTQSMVDMVRRSQMLGPPSPRSPVRPQGR